MINILSSCLGNRAMRSLVSLKVLNANNLPNFFESKEQYIT